MGEGILVSPGASILPGRARKQGREGPRAAKPRQPGLRLASRPGCLPESTPLSIISERPWGRWARLNSYPRPWPVLPTSGGALGPLDAADQSDPSAKAVWAQLDLEPGARGILARGGSQWGPGGASLLRAFRAEPPHDGSIRALEPAGLPTLGRDPAPPSAPWPCSPPSAAAAPETCPRSCLGNLHSVSSPSPSPGSPLDPPASLGPQAPGV